MKPLLSIKKIGLFILIYLACASLLFWIVKEDWSMTAISKETVKPGFLMEELSDGSLVQQTFHADVDTINQISVQPYILETDDAAQIRFTLASKLGKESTTTQRIADLKNGEENAIVFSPSVEGKVEDEWTLTAEVTGKARLSLYAGDSVSTARFDVRVQTDGVLSIDGREQNGVLSMTVKGTRSLKGTRLFWPVALVLLVLCLLFLFLEMSRMRNGRKSILFYVGEVFRRYRYLIKMLVQRDFKVKYKASVLGVFWSFLNPLLMTGVYHFVFSNLFRSNIDNFVVYLMSGIILFNYFSEATNLGMMSIVGNSSLITKVYVPKYIYPVSRVLSSAINLVISFIPLFIIMALTGVPLRKSILLLPFVVIFLICLSTGMSLLLSSMHVFFRDTQFLWSILVTIWNFLTPIFYPESIIPAAFLKYYHMNPMYQICYFARTIILNGVSPTPITYLYCFVASFLPLIVGLLIFRKSQDKFALYL